MRINNTDTISLMIYMQPSVIDVHMIGRVVSHNALFTVIERYSEHI